jgi:hypothetical protein
VDAIEKTRPETIDLPQIPPIVNDRCEFQTQAIEMSHCHGVISADALTPVLVCIHKLEIPQLSSFNRSHDGVTPL